MKITLEFDDQEEATIALQAQGMHSALTTILADLRQTWKHGQDIAKGQQADLFRGQIYAELRDNNVTCID